ncbi:STAS/SEC14 domain-containing protein [Mycobacterium sp. Marseille-P9652]|uniref:STAS/SEC14 domain-containing protein n=1 Tax=Mycobacterium sp. Marseille-P9652 TaxID=2654950 RepID=UPI001E4480EC|nr:STAS/SEC14 domain-containing protein [Mycobacterium sp. Marseille-P9652]
MLDGFPDEVAAFAFRGRVTKADYDAVLVPAFEEKLTRHQKLRMYCEIDATSLEPDAVWADSKFGVAHYFDWDRCAIVSDLPWVRHAAKFSELLGFLWPGKYRTFAAAQAEEARRWIAEDGKRGAA